MTDLDRDVVDRAWTFIVLHSRRLCWSRGACLSGSLTSCPILISSLGTFGLCFGLSCSESDYKLCILTYSAEALDEPEERFLSVLRYYLSGWHVKPKGVKKP
jgi:hypothetical protein